MCVFLAALAVAIAVFNSAKIKKHSFYPVYFCFIIIFCNLTLAGDLIDIMKCKYAKFFISKLFKYGSVAVLCLLF